MSHNARNGLAKGTFGGIRWAGSALRVLGWWSQTSLCPPGVQCLCGFFRYEVAQGEIHLCESHWHNLPEAYEMSDTFVAHDEDGISYTIHTRRTYINTGNLSGRGQPIEGLRSYHLANGGAVNQVDAETYVIVATSKRVQVKV